MEQEKRGAIKAIIFDLGNVIIFYDHMIAARKMAKLVDTSPKKIFEGITKYNKNFLKLFFKGAKPQEYWGALGNEMGIKNIPYKKFDEIWCTIFWPNKKLINQVLKLKKNYKIGLISDTGNLHKNYLSKKYNLSKMFPMRLYSCDVKTTKNHQKIFRIALKKLKVKPSKTIFIDDLQKNVDTANKLGIKAILFRNNSQLKKDLEKFDIFIKWILKNFYKK